MHTGFVNNPFYGEGEMTFSQDGTKLLVAVGTGVLDLFDVDRCTGELSNWVQVSPPAVRGPDNWYGCSFSPDGTKIYASELDLPFNSHLYQWDLTAPNIPASKTLIFSDTTNTYWGQHQLGPNGRIYITTISPDTNAPSNFALSIIHEPNNAGTACVFQYLGLPLQGLRTSGNLPNLPNYSLGGLLSETADAGPPQLICPGGMVQLGSPDQSGGGATFVWSGPQLSDSTAAQPFASPDSTAWYFLTVTDTAYGSPCGETYDSVLVTVADSAQIPAPSLGNDTLVCRGDSVLLGHAPAVQGFGYAWSTTPATNWIYHADSAQTLVAGAGSYFLQVTNPAGIGSCFTATDVVKVTVYADTLPMHPAGNDSLVCNGDSLALGSAAPSAGWQFHWTPVNGLDDADIPTPMAFPNFTTIYVLEAWDSTFVGHCALVDDTVTVTVEQPFNHSAPEDQSFFIGECFLLGVAPVDGYQYQWSPTTGLTSPMSAMTKAQPSATTVYTLTVTNPAVQSANCREQVFEVEVTADACNFQSFVAVNGDGIAEVLDFGDHAGRVSLQVFDMAGRVVFNSTDYQNDWNAGLLAHGLYVYRVEVGGECAKSFVGKMVVLH